MIKAVDFVLKKILSLVYRVLILGVCLFILLAHDNYFEWWEYSIGFLVYGLLFTLFSFKFESPIDENGNEERFDYPSYIRTFLDYSLFILVLYNKDLNEFLLKLTLFIPVLNSLNHSGSKKNWKKKITFISFLAISILFLNNGDFDWGDLIAMILLMLLSAFIQIRLSILSFVERLNTIFEDYYSEDSLNKKPYEILKAFSSKFSKTPGFLRSAFLFSPEEILCFKRKGDGYYLVCSTEFYYEPQIEFPNKVIDCLSDKAVCFNQSLILDGVKKEFNIIVKIKDGGKEYIYFFPTGSNIKGHLREMCVYKFIIPPLNKVTRFIEFENQLNTERKAALRKYKSRFKMLEDTRDTLHLVKNKLTPIYSYFDILKEQEERNEDFSKNLKRLRNKIEVNLKNIKDHSTPYLKRDFDLHENSEMDSISVKKLFGLLVDLFHEETGFVVNVNVKNYDDDKKDVRINKEMLYFLFSEIIMNTEEHSLEGSHVRLVFDFKGKYLGLTIQNTAKEILDRELLLKTFNKNEVSLTLEKRFNGLTIIKRYLLGLGISHELRIIDNKFILELKFKCYEGSDF